MRRPAFHGWRPALRIAWRDALRHRGRSILVLVMIALPVLAVSAAAVVLRTADVSAEEGADRHMGAAEARLWTDGSAPVLQAPDPEAQGWTSLDGAAADTAAPLEESDVVAVLGAGTRLVPIREGWSAIRIDERVVDLDVTEIDLGDPVAGPLFELTSGRLPRTDGEVVANDALLEKGVAIGDDLDLGGRDVVLVGVGRHPENRTMPSVLGPLGSALPEDDAASGSRAWLVDGAPVDWDEVQALNELGGVVISRAVLADPPETSAFEEQMGADSGPDDDIAVAVLVVVMALLEVVLLAGPAFAVGARRQARALALMSASGGTPAQARRVVLASGVVLGAAAAALGSLLGVISGIALLPVVQLFQSTWFGPVDVPLAYLAGIAGFGLLSAFLAACVPAWLASRQDVVAVLAGRRGDRRPRATTPVVGLVLLGLGIAGSSYGAATSDGGSGAVWIAASAVVSVLGMILVVPVVVALVARLGRRLPLTARYAARDAARHRTRTVPAVAAVAATVAGVVALGIANASDELENERTYQPRLAMGAASLTVGPGEVLPGEAEPDRGPFWDRAEELVRDVAPQVQVRRVHSVEEATELGYSYAYLDSGPDPQEAQLVITGPSVMVADTATEAGIDGETSTQVDEALAAGRMVVFADEPTEETRATLVLETLETGPAGLGEPETARHVLPASHVTAEGGTAPAAAVVPRSVVDDLGLPVSTFDLRLTGDLDQDTAVRIEESVAGAFPNSFFYVERGYQRPDEAVIVLLVLAGLGAVLMLGGTLTATFLALSDARPDLATLSAVGASPRTRRRVAASYALVIGLVGALLGAAVGFIPGIAISRPLTSFAGSGPYLAIPWLLIGVLVVALPLLTAAVVGLTARGRLPLVARLD